MPSQPPTLALLHNGDRIPTLGGCWKTRGNSHKVWCKPLTEHSVAGKEFSRQAPVLPAGPPWGSRCTPLPSPEFWGKDRVHTPYMYKEVVTNDRHPTTPFVSKYSVATTANGRQLCDNHEQSWEKTVKWCNWQISIHTILQTKCIKIWRCICLYPHTNPRNGP